MGYANAGGPVMGAVALLAFVACVWLVMQRSTYLPFLGPAVLPSSVLAERRVPKNATVIVDIPSKADKIVYWASEPSKTKPNPWAAYKDFKNSGVVDVTNGIAEVHLRCPGTYVVRGKVLPRHVHYREVLGSGMMSDVKTVGVICA
jgi:hypothetical protein